MGMKNPLHVGEVMWDTSNTANPSADGTISYVNGTGFRMNISGTSYTIPTSSGAATAYDDIGDPDASGSISFAGYTGTYTSTTANWGGLIMSNTHANPTAGANLLTLGYTADGDAHGVFLDCKDNSSADSKFTIGADGNTVIAGTAAATDALTLTVGDVTLEDGHLNISADNRRVTFGASEATDSYILFDGTSLTFYDSELGGTVTLKQLNDSTVTGDLTIGNGQFIWTDSTDEVAGTWTFAGTTNNDVTWTSDVTTADCLSITADDLTTGSMIYLESSSSGMAGKYIQCYDGAADDFSVGANGAVIIAGNASGTDAITITAGDITQTSGDLTLTDGNIVMSEGKITVDTTTDETSYIKRNQAATTGVVFEIEETNAAADNETLLIDSNATGAVGSVTIDHEGTADCITVTSKAAAASILKATAEAATGTVVEAISAASATVGMVTVTNGGTGATGWLGADGVGQVMITNDGNLAHANASSLLITYSGTGAANGMGTSLRIVDTGGTATSYAFYVSAATGEAIKVDAGAVVIDESLTVGTTLGVTGITTLAESLDIVIADTTNNTAIYAIQNDTTNNPILCHFDNSGTGNGVFLDQDGNGIALNIDSDATGSTAINIDHDTNNASTIFAVTIDSDNAGAGAGGGIDMSGMTANADFLFKVPTDNNDPTGGGGAATGRITIDDGAGNKRYIAYYT